MVDGQRSRSVVEFRARRLLWLSLVIAVVVPLAVAASSSLLAYRDPVYVVAGFAGVVAMAFLLIQPLLVGGYLAGLSGRRGRVAHRWVGGLLLVAIVVHVVGLWITSPPDVIDALLFRSPTPFSVWGVVAMWALFAAALLAAFRRRLNLGASSWRFAHSALALIVVVGSVIHAVQIEGTMGEVSKALLCALALIVTAVVIYDLRSWALLTRKRY